MENSLSKMRPHLVSEWSEKNSPLTPDTVTFGSNKTVWWKGSCGHEWQTSIKARSAGEQCPICSGARVLQGYNDFESKFPDLAKEWSPKNEPLRPSMITAATHRKGNMAVQARTRMDGIREKSDGERYGLSLLLTQLCATGLQRLGKPFS